MTIWKVLSYSWHIWKCIEATLGYFYRLLKGIPVSYPGDPLKRPISRVGRWRDEEFHSLEPGWKFYCDKESHAASLQQFPDFPLTGESAGRQIWQHDESAHNETPNTFSGVVNPNSADKVFRGIMLSKWEGKVPDESVKPENAYESAKKGLEFYQMLQCEDGHWAGDYGGPNFLMPGLICTLYVTKAPFSDAKKRAMILYLKNHQQADGGWGTHIECASTMFGTILSYVALRLLGVGSEEDYMTEARNFIHQHGGALYAPSWAKFWLAVIGVYDWTGINSIPAEMWLLPRWFPFHPGKLWCHCRMVYLPMCYIYCKRFTPNVEEDPVLLSLRSEIYLEKYENIKWDDFRQTCAEIDEYSPLNPVMKVAQDILAIYEWLLPKVSFLNYIRKKALEFVVDYIHAEDAQTNYIDIGPVNKALNMLSVWIDSGKDSNCEAFQRHIPRVDDYLWVAEDGMKMQGYNGSQCWDTSFAIQAIVEGDFTEVVPDCSRKVYEYLNRTQIKNDEISREYYFRQVSKGGWPFSTAAHGWPISDCTAEGLKGVLALHEPFSELIPPEKRISEERLKDACNVILTLHNEDGGWATYENNRGYGWYELLNPSEVFGDIMIDYSYVECTSACITALRSFSKCFPDHRPTEVLSAIQAGRKFIRSIQRPDGSWYGSWGVCFTYATWFGLEGLIASGEPANSPAVQRANSYLLSRQNPNGGWGESYLSCVNKVYSAEGTGEYGEDGSGVVQTAWALLGLLIGDCSDNTAIDRGVRYLMRKQLANGDWDQEGITGVFNRSCGITYTAYRNIFPIWALGRYNNKYGKDGISVHR